MIFKTYPPYHKIERVDEKIEPLLIVSLHKHPEGQRTEAK
jgi:hypothetical protein